MFPHPQGQPTSVGQGPVGLLVPALVAGDLVGPVPVVDVMAPPAVLGAAVPETAIHKNRDPGRPEDYVGLTAQGGKRRPMKTVAKAQRMKGAAQDKFRAGTFSSLDAHTLADGFARSKGCAPRLHVPPKTTAAGTAGGPGWARPKKTPMAPRRAPSAEQIERRISDPLCGAGGGFPLRQREYTVAVLVPSGRAYFAFVPLGPVVGRAVCGGRVQAGGRQRPPAGRPAPAAGALYWGLLGATRA